VRKRLLTGLSLLLLLAAGFGLGMFVQWRVKLGVEEAKAKFTENIIRQFAGDDRPIPPPPPFEEFRYQGAHSDSRKGGSSQRVMGKQVRAAGTYEVLLTSDDFDKVVGFYWTKVGFNEKAPTSPFYPQFSQVEGFSGEEKHCLADNVLAPAVHGKTRPLRAVCLVHRCSSYDLTVFVTRAEGEKYTHVVLLYNPRASRDAPE
jgi:hypothetical protein